MRGFPEGVPQPGAGGLAAPSRAVRGVGLDRLRPAQLPQTESSAQLAEVGPGPSRACLGTPELRRQREVGAVTNLDVHQGLPVSTPVIRPNADPRSIGVQSSDDPVARAGDHGSAAPRLGYLVKAFPRISETFILNEILQLERQGFRLHIYALNRPRDTKRHRLVDEVRSPLTSLPEPLWRALPRVLADHCWVLRRFPFGYICTWVWILVRDPGLFKRFTQAAVLGRLLKQDRIEHLHA